MLFLFIIINQKLLMYFEDDLNTRINKRELDGDDYGHSSEEEEEDLGELKFISDGPAETFEFEIA